MADQAKIRAEIRRRKLLQNAESRMRKVLGDAPDEDNLSIASQDSEGMLEDSFLTSKESLSSINIVNKAVIEKSDYIETALPKNRTYTNHQNEDTAKDDETELDKKPMKQKQEKIIVQKKESFVWFLVCMAISSVLSVYTSSIQGTNFTFFNGFIAFLALYISYMIFSNQLFVISDAFFVSMSTIVIDMLKVPVKLKKLFKVMVNFLYLSVDYFCLYSFCFFGVYKLLS